MPTTSFLTSVKSRFRSVLMRSLLLVLCCLFLQACAHSNLVERADDLQQEQRYELAMDSYRQALTLRPNNSTTIEKLNGASQAFDSWLLELEESANLAYQNEFRGKALLLYGKLAIHSNDPVVNDRYENLLDSLSAFSQFYAHVDYDPIVLGSNLEQGINNLIPLNMPLDATNPSAGNELNLSFAFEQGEFSIVEREVYEAGEYISGYQYVDNPELLSLQRHLPDLRFKIRESRYDVERYRDFVRANERELARLERNADNDADSDSEQAINEARRQLNRSQQRLHQYRRELEERQRELDHELIRLTYLPLTIREDIYSEHVYSVTESTLNLEGQLLISNSGVINQQALLASSFDVYYEEQPILGLPYNPLEHTADAQLEVELNAQARTEARQHLRNMVASYRQGLLTRANTLTNRDERMEAWVLYGLSGSNGVSASVAERMTQQLQDEVGVGGELFINRLLHP